MADIGGGGGGGACFDAIAVAESASAVVAASGLFSRFLTCCGLKRRACLVIHGDCVWTKVSRTERQLTFMNTVRLA